MNRTADILDRPPPADPDAEHGLIGAALLDPSILDRTGSTISEVDFHDADCGKLWSALVTLRGAGEPIGDMVTLVPGLRQLGLPERIASPASIGQLIGAGVVSNADFYAHRVRQLALLRGLADTATELLQRVHRVNADPTDIAEWLDARREALTAGVATGVRSFKEVAIEVLDSIDQPADVAGGTFTGLESLDNVLGALLPGEVTVLAARTGIGKTSLAGQIAGHSARHGRPVLYASLEMSDRELVQRQLCAAAGVNSIRVRTRRLDPRDRRHLVDAAGELGALPLWLWSPPSTTFPRLRGVARMHHAQHPLRLLIVDYVGLIQRDDWRIPEHEHIGRVSAGVKQLAKELSVPVLLLAQLNREADKDDPPRLSHLAKSGAIEQDADAVLLLHRPRGESETQCIIAKNRHGATGSFALDFDARSTRFADAAPQRHEVFDRFNNCD